VKDFGKDVIYDADHQQIPQQDFFFLEFENGYSYAVRGSGTEPKIKFYVFGQKPVFSLETLEAVKLESNKEMEELMKLIEADAHARAEL